MDHEGNRARLLLPLYAGLMVMAGSSIAALGFAIDSPDFTARAYLLAFLGLTASFTGALIGRNPGIVGAIVAAMVFPLLVLSNTGAPITRVFFPDETLTDHSLLLPTMSIWGIIALSFAQVSRPNSIFLFVCGLVVFGLTGTVNINESLLISFFLFLLAAFFVWSYNGSLNLLEHAREAGQQIILRPWRWAHTQVGVAVALLAIVFAVSVVIGYPTYESTSAFLLTPLSQKYRPRVILPILRNYAGFSEQFSLAGGAIQLDESLALTVESDAPALWRGLAYDYYTQRGWERTDAGDEYPLPERPYGSSKHQLWPKYIHSPEPARTKTIRQTIRMHTGTSGVLLGAAQPVSVRGLSFHVHPHIDPYGCLHGRFPQGFERRYEVTSVAPDPTDKQLAAAPDDPQDYPEVIWDSYRQVPIGTQARLQELADEITAGCPTAYAKAEAIQGYLYEHCRYTLDVPPIPVHQDAVAYFLLTTKRGACDLYASSLVMLLRLADVPARVVTGYATGEWDPEQRAYVVTGTEAHAWAEVYFPGIGWVEYDPPSQQAADRFAWLSKLFQPGWSGPTLRLLARRALVGLIVLLAINALVIAVSGASPVRLTADWFRRRRQPLGARQQVAMAYLSVCKQLERRGVPRAGWQTPSDYLWQVSTHQELPDEIRGADMPGLTEAFLRLRYAEPTPSLAEVDDFADQARTLARKIRRSKRTRGQSRTN